MSSFELPTYKNISPMNENMQLQCLFHFKQKTALFKLYQVIAISEIVMAIESLNRIHKDLYSCKTILKIVRPVLKLYKCLIGI